MPAFFMENRKKGIKSRNFMSAAMTLFYESEMEKYCKRLRNEVKIIALRSVSILYGNTSNGY